MTLEELLVGRRTALLVIDMQNDFCHPDGAVAKRGGDVEPIQAMAPRLRRLLAAARRRGLPIIHVRTHHSPWTNSESWVTRHHGLNVVQCFPGSWGADFYAGFEPVSDDRWTPGAHEYVVTKHRFSAFIDTDLDLVLRSQTVQTLILTGATTDVCVESTARDGFMKDYAIVFVSDCTATSPATAHQAALESIRRSFGRVVSADELEAVWAAPASGTPASARARTTGIEVRTAATPASGTSHPDRRPFKKEVLLDDERERGFPAVVRFGPYLFVSGSDGHRDPQTERIVPDLAWKAVEQCRNSYGRIRRRLEQAGHGGGCAVRIQNFTSGQDWRLQRMALWPEYFGEAEHGLAVSFGAQARMSGINMITTTVMGVTPDVERVAVAPQPTPGRAARVVRAEPFVYVIGVGGLTHPRTREAAPEEVPEAFERQLRYAADWLATHLDRAGVAPRDLVRLDACIRDVNRAPAYHRFWQEQLGGEIPFATSAIGLPLGGRAEHEIGGLALAPGATKEVAWREDRPGVAEAVKAGQLVFVSGCSGLGDASTGRVRPEGSGEKPAQTRQALQRLEAALARFSLGLGDLLRLDIFLRDIYFEDACLELVRDRLGKDAPTMTVIGAEPADSAEVELTAIAGAP
ncbi:MAG TPA: isochorismatase family protein [Methylomirabilota bacterium]|nr:isochorismatase family protein [Methylomirabilota bacterium]